MVITFGKTPSVSLSVTSCMLCFQTRGWWVGEWGRSVDSRKNVAGLVVGDDLVQKSIILSHICAK